MNRRSFLGVLAALPIVGKLIPKAADTQGTAPGIEYWLEPPPGGWKMATKLEPWPDSLADDAPWVTFQNTTYPSEGSMLGIKNHGELPVMFISKGVRTEVELGQTTLFEGKAYPAGRYIAIPGQGLAVCCPGVTFPKSCAIGLFGRKSIG